MTQEVYTKEGAQLVRTVTESRVAKYNLKFLREQKKRIKAELDEVQALIDQATLLKVEEPVEEVVPIEKLP
jgi:hypothetical protein